MWKSSGCEAGTFLFCFLPISFEGRAISRIFVVTMQKTFTIQAKHLL